MYEMCFGSNYIALAVGANLKEVDEQERLKLFRWLDSHGQSRSTAGWLFENYCHRFLSSGINTEARPLTMGADDLQVEMSSGYHRIVELESIKENIYLVPDVRNLPAVDSFFIDRVKKMVYLFQITISRDHSIDLKNLIEIVMKFELNKCGFPFALVFVVPSNMVNDYPKQMITGADLFDDLENRSVEEIRGIGPKTAKKLTRDLKISSQHDFYTAAHDKVLLQKLMVIVKTSYISKFVEIVDGIQQYKELINIPQFVLGINVERSMDMESFKRQKLKISS
jgi:hypothetical protein